MMTNREKAEYRLARCVRLAREQADLSRAVRGAAPGSLGWFSTGLTEIDLAILVKRAWPSPDYWSDRRFAGGYLATLNM